MPYELDIFVRQQIALEAVKNGVVASFTDFNAETIAIITAVLLSLGYKTFADVPKKELRAALSEINRRMSVTIKGFRALTEKTLLAIMDADIAVTTALMSHLSGKRVTMAGAGTNRRKLWARLTNEIIPGSGLTIPQMMLTFFNSSMNDIKRSINGSYADNVSITEAIRRLTGTKLNNYKDGITRRIFNSFGATMDTIIQSMTSSTVAFFGKLFTDTYEWVSVIDSSTTDICRGRNGRVYKYGEGPIPPAHYRCRSRIRPIFNPASALGPQTWFGWIKQQPAKVQNFVLGAARGRDLRAGRIEAKDMQRFASNRRLTPQQYRDSVNLFLT